MQLRPRSSALLVIIGLGLSSAACKKDDANGDKVPDRVSGGAITGQTGEDLGLLPVDSELVMGVNFQTLQQSQMWSKFVQPKLMASVSKLEEFKAQCGFDPLATVTSVSVSVKNLGAADKPDIAIVVHGPNKAKVLDCLEKMKDKATAEGDEITADGDGALIKTKHNDMIAMLFVSDNTMLVMGPHSSRDAIKAQAGGGSTLKSSPKFVEMYSKITTTDTMWGLMNGDSKIFKRLPIAKPKAVYGSVNITDGVASDIYMRLGTPDDATQLAQLIKSQAAPAISMVDTFEVTSDGPEVHVKGSASLQKITNLTSLLGLGTHRGPMGGGAGGP